MENSFANRVYEIGECGGTQFWNLDELLNNFRRLEEIEDPFDPSVSLNIIKRRVNVYGYPLLISLDYRAPQTLDLRNGLLAVPGESRFELPIDANGRVRINRTLLDFSVGLAEGYDNGAANLALKFDFTWQHGIEANLRMEISENGTVNTLHTSDGKEKIYVPNIGVLLTPTRLSGYVLD
jgi:hypothetical protein